MKSQRLSPTLSSSSIPIPIPPCSSYLPSLIITSVEDHILHNIPSPTPLSYQQLLPQKNPLSNSNTFFEEEKDIIEANAPEQGWAHLHQVIIAEVLGEIERNPLFFSTICAQFERQETIFGELVQELERLHWGYR